MSRLRGLFAPVVVVSSPDQDPGDEHRDPPRGPLMSISFRVPVYRIIYLVRFKGDDDGHDPGDEDRWLR
jgi:hypothetical protein